MAERERETLRDVKRYDVDVWIVVDTKPLEGFFSLWTTRDKVEMFGCGDDIVVERCGVIYWDSYA